MNHETNQPLSSVCIHCGNPLKSDYGSAQFCCHGCETVFAVLKERGWNTYYDLKSTGMCVRKRAPVDIQIADDLKYLDQPDFIKTYGKSVPLNDENLGQRVGTQILFYVEGVHCVACIWLLEKVRDWIEGVYNIRIDLGQAVATVVIEPNGSIAAVANEFVKLGYKPHPIQRGQASALQEQENRTHLIRMGVAGACMMNLMLMAVPLYAGVAGPFAHLFRYISLPLFLPVFFYSAVPFYKSAWSAIRARTVSIDIPIVLGVVVGAIASVVNLATGSEHIYFDSLAALVFLLLSSRVVLRRFQQRAIQSSELIHFLAPNRASRWSSELNEFETVPLEKVAVGDLVRVGPHEPLPVDGIVHSVNSSKNEEAQVNMALLSGESEPKKVKCGSVVFAGTQNLQSSLVISVNSSGAESRLGRILHQMENSLRAKPAIVTAADRMAKRFVVAILVASFSTLVITGLMFGWSEGFARALAMAVVTCPCALALATPLAMVQGLGKAAKLGILVKTADVLEKLQTVKTAFVDKTGTLTEGKFEVLKVWSDPSQKADDLFSLVNELERRSAHPIAIALTNFLKNKALNSVSVEQFKEISGRGIEAYLGERLVEMKKVSSAVSVFESGQPGTEVGLFIDQKCVAMFLLGDRLRLDSLSAVQALNRLGISVKILSGDSRAVVESVATQLKIGTNSVQPGEFIYADMTPEQKGKVVKTESNCLMIGDGANDMVALAEASVGVSVHGGMEISLRAADVFNTAPGMNPVVQLIEISFETMKVIRRNFRFSLVYNISGAIAAATGLINPFTAALLMPASALTVFLSSVTGTSRLRKILGDGAHK